MVASDGERKAEDAKKVAELEPRLVDVSLTRSTVKMVLLRISRKID